MWQVVCGGDMGWCSVGGGELYQCDDVTSCVWWWYGVMYCGWRWTVSVWWCDKLCVVVIWGDVVWVEVNCISVMMWQVVVVVIRVDALLVEVNCISVMMWQFVCDGGTRWCSLSTLCLTIWQVAGSIIESVAGFFHWLNPSGHTMALMFLWPLNRNEYQGYLVGV